MKETQYHPCVHTGLRQGLRHSFTMRVFNDDNNNNNRRLVTLAEHTSDHGKQTNSSTNAKGEQG